MTRRRPCQQTALLPCSGPSPSTASPPTAAKCWRSMAAPSTPRRLWPHCWSQPTGSARWCTSASRTRRPSRSCCRSSPRSTSPESGRSLDRGDVVELKYLDQNHRAERQTHFMAPIRPEDVEFVLDADAFVCVPITDYQVSQDTLHYHQQNSLRHHPAGRPRTDGRAHPGWWASAPAVDRTGRLAALHRHLEDEPGRGRLQLVPAAGRADSTTVAEPLARRICRRSPSTAWTAA